MNYAYHVADFYAGSLNKLYGYASVVAWNDDVPVRSIALQVGGIPTAKLVTAGMYLAKLGATDIVHCLAMIGMGADGDMIDEAAAQRFMVYVWSTPHRVSYWRHPIHMADDGTIVADLTGWEERPVNGDLCRLMGEAWANPLEADVLAVTLDTYGANIQLR